MCGDSTKPTPTCAEAPRDRKILLALALAALALRLPGIFDGLPFVYNGDEPHFINTAVYFGGGTLNPPFFKYPTLWPYSLFASFCALFAAWSGFGLLHSPADFGVKFAADPSMFYITGRLLACLLSCAAIWPVYGAALLLRNRRAALAAAAIFTFLPQAADSARYATWDSPMLALGAAAWYFAAKIYASGRRRDYLLCGLMLGLCCATHYTACFFCALLPAAHFARKDGAWRDLLWGTALIPAGFLLATPYALLDFGKFSAGIRDVFAYSAARRAEGFSRLSSAGEVLSNIIWFGGRSPAVLLAAFGAALLSWRLSAMLLAPLAVCAAFMSNQPDGGFARYIFASLPALCILAAAGIDGLSVRKRIFAAFLAAALLPELAACAALARESLLPDTRAVSGRWIEEHIPPETALLLDQAHVSPSVKMSSAQAEQLYRKTAAAGNGRAGYYRYLAQANIGNGYRIYRMDRSASGLATMPAQLEQARQAQDLVDISGGLAAAKRDNIAYAAVSSEGVNPAREPYAAAFLAELGGGCPAAAEFAPQPGRIKGPRITVYDIRLCRQRAPLQK
ncbi:MAG: glycosyltransferase family 39 protein [Elusimicrobiales bacterium]